MRSSLYPRIVRTVVAPLLLALLIVTSLAARRSTQLELQTTLLRNQDYAHSLASLQRNQADETSLCQSTTASTRVLLIHAESLAVLCDSDSGATALSRLTISGQLADAVRGKQTHALLHSHVSGADMPTALAAVDGKPQVIAVSTEIHTPFWRRWYHGAPSLVALALTLLAWLAARRIGSQVAANFHLLHQSLRHTHTAASLPEFKRLQSEIDQRLQELTQLTDTALEQRDELNFILDSMPESVLIFDRERRLLRYNDAARKLLEIRGSEGNGQVIEFVIRHNGLIRFVDAVLNSQDAAYRETTLEWNNRATYAASGVQVEWAGLSKAIVVLRDLTASKRLEQIKSDFVSNASHELQTPLTAIRGYSETLLDGAHDNPDIRLKFLDTIHRHAVRLEALVKDLLSLARIEREESAIELVEQPLRPIAESVVTLTAARMAETAARIDLQIPVNLTARLNARLFEQALLNLIENALKYSPHGSMVRVSAYRNESGITVEIEDNGPGIAAEHLPRLFERFYRVDPARSRSLGGTGLGLAIVKHVAMAHGGTVSVESRVGRGSCFRITLPGPKT